MSTDPHEQVAEAAYKRGFDQGIQFQKKADPPPRARDLALQLVKERAVWAEKRAAFAELAAAAAEFLAAQSSDSVPKRQAARARLVGALEVKP